MMAEAVCVSSRKLVHLGIVQILQALLLIGGSRVWGFYIWAFPHPFRGSWIVTKPQIYSSCCNKDRKRKLPDQLPALLTLCPSSWKIFIFQMSSMMLNPPCLCKNFPCERVCVHIYVFMYIKIQLIFFKCC